MAYRPRKRARSQNVRVYWQPLAGKRVLGFAGYKVGMTHVSYVDNSESPTKGQEVVSAATVIEVPPVTVYGVRTYLHDQRSLDIMTADERVLKLLGVKKMASASPKNEEVAGVHLLVFTQPSKTSIGKKHIEKMELGIGGKDVNEKLEYAKSMLGKDISFKDVFKQGEFVDAIGVTKGKGWQGAVKRFGIATQRPKATGKYRHVGTLGQWHPAYVLYTIPQAGQMGYHSRTELNKQIVKVGEKPEDINPHGGFTHYGFVKNDYVVLKGSIPGPVKRLIKLRLAVRNSNTVSKDSAVNYISLDSKR